MGRSSIDTSLNKKRAALLASASLLIAAFPISGAAVATDTDTGVQNGGTLQQQEQPVDEVTIEAHREKLSRLRAEIKKAADAYYEAFNNVNTVPGYETHCNDELRPGTRIARHVCTPQFVESATEGDVQSFFFGNASIPANVLIALRYRGYIKYLRELTEKDPKLHQAALDFDALTQQYQRVSREKVKGQ